MSRGFRDSDATQAMSEKEIASAIDRLLEDRGDAGDPAAADGRCADCGNPIGDERRRALPSARRCVTCQARWESSHRR